MCTLFRMNAEQTGLLMAIGDDPVCSEGSRLIGEQRHSDRYLLEAEAGAESQLVTSASLPVPPSRPSAP